MKSLAQKFAALSKAEKLKRISKLSEAQADQLLKDWSFWARPDQMYNHSGDWYTWLINAGRGFGKTRTGAETIRHVVQKGYYKRIALVAPTASDARDVMVEGESGIMSICHDNFRPIYQPSKRRLIWPNGAICTTYSADEPDRLRGPQHDFAWMDELAAYRYTETYDMLQFGLRLGNKPRQIVTTTPRPTKLIKALMKDSLTKITSGSTLDNSANLAKTFLRQIVAKYEGTRLGRQELYAEVLDDNPNALWQRNLIDDYRVNIEDSGFIVFKRIVVAIDPATTSGDESDETGIIVAGLDEDNIAYILEDCSGKYSPDGFADKAISLYDKYSANAVIAETNQGGDMIETILRSKNKNVNYRGVRAKHGKYARAEPVAALYEQNKVRHIGSFAKLEDQLCEYDPHTFKKSPDRLDALVYALTDLLLVDGNTGMLDFIKSQAIAKENEEKSADKVNEFKKKQEEMKNKFKEKFKR